MASPVASPVARILLLALLIWATAPAHAQHPGLTRPQDIPALITAATAAGDSAAMASLYAGDALLMTPQGQAFNGREAIRAVFARNHAIGPNRITFTETRTDADEQRAIMLLAWDLRMEPRGQPPVIVRGRTMLYVKKIAVGWVIVADMYQNLPPPGPPGPPGTPPAR